ADAPSGSGPAARVRDCVLRCSRCRPVGRTQVTAVCTKPGAVQCAGGGTWTDVGNGGTAIADISSFRIVPGDTVRYTCDSTLTAEGDNLEATLTANLNDVTGSADLRNALTTTIDGEYAGQSFTGGSDGIQVTANSGAAQPISVDVTIAFDPATSGTTGQGQTVDLGNLSLNLQQNTNPAPA
ncbi:alternate-type signal peptide domain-containing protein, partial [Rhodococcus sp. 5G237]